MHLLKIYLILCSTFFLNTQLLSQEIVAFDIDGTITEEGYDLWMLSTTKLIKNTDKHQNVLKTWKRNKKSNPYDASLVVMNEVIQLLPDQLNSEQLESTVFQIVNVMISEQSGVRAKAIEKIKDSLKNGYQVAFCTTNFIEGGKGFLRSLVYNGLLSSQEASKIKITGTVTDWKKKSVIHFNMDQGKLTGLSRELNLPLATIKHQLSEAYGDDPLGNDKALLDNAKTGYIISTQKNQKIVSKHQRLIW